MIPTIPNISLQVIRSKATIKSEYKIYFVSTRHTCPLPQHG